MVKERTQVYVDPALKRQELGAVWHQPSQEKIRSVLGLGAKCEQNQPRDVSSRHMATRQHDQALLSRAERFLPGGVNSPVRAFRAVRGAPVFIARAQGAYLHDTIGTQFIDYVGSWGPMILGHAHPAVVSAIQEAAALGTSYGAPTEREVVLAETITKLYPSIEMLRLTSSGTEAAMSAARVARGATGRDVVVKMEGCYHGHADLFLVKAGSGLATFGNVDSAGVPKGAVENTVVVPFNDLAALGQIFEQAQGRIAAVFLEPVVGNMGCVPPKEGYLASVHALCAQHGAVCVFDEVMTGCRVALGGAQALYDVRPHMTVLGKIIGGGMPLAAYGSSRSVMQNVAPLGPVYQAGTLSGNPIATAAAMATLNLLDEKLYVGLETYGATLQAEIEAALARHSIPGVVQRVGSMFTLFFTERPKVESWDDAKTCDTKRFSLFHEKMLASGIYLPPSQFEAAFFSAAHGETELTKTVEAVKAAIAGL